MTAATEAREHATPVVAVGRRGFPFGRLAVHAVLFALMILWIVPTLGLFVNSFRPAADVAQTGWWNALAPPWTFTLDNYAHVIAANNLGDSFVNSLFITIPATIIPVMVAAFAGYAFAWMKFPFKNAIFVAIVGLLVIPLQSTLIPVLRLLAGWGIAGDYLAVWLAHTGYGLPFAVYLLRNFFASLPGELFEAARIDGATDFQAFVRIAVPLSRPALASLAIFQFLWVWNDLLAALIFLGGNQDVAPITLTVSNMVSSRGEGWQTLTAAAFVSMAVPLTVFLAMQRHFVNGLLTGATKG